MIRHTIQRRALLEAILVGGARIFALLLLSSVFCVACSRKASDPRASLVFAAEGAPDRVLPLARLLDAIAVEEVRGWDPYYKKEKRFRALPLGKVLALGFGKSSFEKDELVLRATDGYAAYFRGALAMEEGAYVAFEDLDAPGWEPIGPQRANPAPFYVVWSKPEQVDLETHPRPWQLARIEIVRFDVAYPKTKPPDGNERGYALYRERCFKCHAVNREGGRVGPDLNVPKNVLEYRSEDQVRAYIRNPAAFRYGNMPPHPDLSETQLDELIGYLRAMKDRKDDPGK